MTRRYLFAMILCVLLLTPHLAAASYEMAWHTIDAGGGQSTGGSYTLTGTVGQADAGTSSGSAYSLTGGFWGIVTIAQEMFNFLLWTK